jgi:hypothetical protein
MIPDWGDFTKLVTLLIAGFGLAGGALACPDKSDLKEGITLTRNKPYLTETFTLTAEGLLTRTSIGGRPVLGYSEYIHPLLRPQGRDPRSDLGFEFDQLPSAGELDRLPDIKHRSTTGKLLLPNGREERLTFHLRFLGYGNETVGTCRYDGWYIEEAQEDMETLSAKPRKLFFAPDLGLVLSAVSIHPFDLTRRVFSYDAIE